MNSTRSLFVPFALVALAAITPAQDILNLKDGRFFEVPRIERAEGGLSLKFDNGPIFCPDALVHDYAMSSEPIPAPTTPEEEAKLAEGQVRYEGKWVTLKRREELLKKKVEAKRAQLVETRAEREWRNRRKEDTPHFHFEYTVPQHIFEEYRDTMEAYFTEFTRFWKIRAPAKTDRLNVCFHGDMESYSQVGGVDPNVLGFFRYVRPWELNIYYDRRDPDMTTEVMFHEANHYLQKLIDLGFAFPHFPGESIAEYYGASHWDPKTKKLEVGLMLEWRAIQIHDDIAQDEHMPLSKLLSTDRMFEHYSWGWSLVHFLMNDPRYKEKFPKFVVALAKGKDVERHSIHVDNLYTAKGDEVMRVFMKEHGIKDANALRQLESEWHQYVDTKVKVESADGKAKAGIDAARRNRPLRALRLLGEAIEGGTKLTNAYLYRARLLYARGKTEDAVALMRKVIEIDPLDGEFYAVLGYMLSSKKETEDEGEELKKLSRELGYDTPIRIKLAKDKDGDEEEGGEGGEGGDDD